MFSIIFQHSTPTGRTPFEEITKFKPFICTELTCGTNVKIEPFICTELTCGTNVKIENSVLIKVTDVGYVRFQKNSTCMYWTDSAQHVMNMQYVGLKIVYTFATQDFLGKKIAWDDIERDQFFTSSNLEHGIYIRGPYPTDSLLRFTDGFIEVVPLKHVPVNLNINYIDPEIQVF